MLEALIGRRDRRNGPIPPTHVQIALREVLAKQGDLEVFVPWGARKLRPGWEFDEMERGAISRLVDLQREMLPRRTHFTFRVENVADRWLLGPEGIPEYVSATRRCCHDCLSHCTVRLESECAAFESFASLADDYAEVFWLHLTQGGLMDNIRLLGWRGELEPAQCEYYYKAYRRMYPDLDPRRQLARYFASNLARVKVGCGLQPPSPHVKVAFSGPIPGSPMQCPVVYYRCVPRPMSNFAPWNARWEDVVGTGV